MFTLRGGGGGSNVEHAVDACSKFFFFLFSLTSKEGWLIFFQRQNRELSVSVGIAIFASRGGFFFEGERVVRGFTEVEFRFFENSHIFYSRCKGFLSFDARNAINRFETKNRRIRRTRRNLLYPDFSSSRRISTHVHELFFYF